MLLVARGNVQEDSGSITAPEGTAELVTGGTVLLHDSSSSRQVFVHVSQQWLCGPTPARFHAAHVNLASVDGNVFTLAGNNSAICARPAPRRGTGTSGWWRTKAMSQIHSGVGGGSQMAAAARWIPAEPRSISATRHCERAAVEPERAGELHDRPDDGQRPFGQPERRAPSVDAGRRDRRRQRRLNGNINWGSGASLTFAAGHDVRLSTGR